VRAATVRAAAAALPAGYLLGSVPVAVLVGRRQGIDPRGVGDRNPGYWNVKEQLGRRRAAPVFAGDALKGALAAAVGRALEPDGAWGVGYGAVGAAMVGHAFPAFAGFRGGRSVLTFVGGMCVLSPRAAGVAAAACAAVTATSSFTWGARVGVFGFPLAQLALDSPHRTAATGALMTIIGLRFAAARRTPAPATSPTGGTPPG
jgi:glycerol-3-phosphate acyltransferase PlsY